MKFGDTALDFAIGRLLYDFDFKKNLQETILGTLQNYHLSFPALKKHSELTAFIGMCVANKIGVDPKKEFSLDILHDVGKMWDLKFFIMLSELKTKPTDEQYERIKTHSFQGYSFLMEREHLFCAHGAAWHHKFRLEDPYGPELYEIEMPTGQAGVELRQCCWRLGVYDFMEAFMTRESENVHGIILSESPLDKIERLKMELEKMYGKDETIDVALEICHQFIGMLIQLS